MSDLSTRARVLATRDRLISGTSKQDRVTVLIDLYKAIGDLGVMLAWASPQTGAQEAPKALGRVLYDLTVLSSLMGIDVVDGIIAAIEQREISGKKVVPGTMAPVPNAMNNDGTMRDPATGQEPWPET
jgi:hypothetical protein